MRPATAARQIVIHHDDIGANHATNTAFVELSDLGFCTCGSVMVPCPWFDEMAEIARGRPDLDLGVHLTLNAEFAKYRWRPLTGVSDNGLTDAHGYMPRTVSAARRADPAAVEAELRAQVDTALAAGIDVTHLDAHMGTAQMPEFLDIYLRLGEDYRLPVMLPALAAALAFSSGAAYSASTLDHYRATLDRGNPAFDGIVWTPFGARAAEADAYRAIFAATPPGRTFGAFHFNPAGEIEHYSPDAQLRITEYELFRSGAVQAILAELGIEPVGMRRFRDALRAG